LLFEESKKQTQLRLQQEEKKVCTGKPKINTAKTSQLVSPKTPKVPMLNFDILVEKLPDNEIARWQMKQQILEQDRLT
jgi:hypothetical protein